VGAAFCKAALEGAKLNVLINTKIMKNEELKQKTEAELEELVSAGTAKAESIYRFVEGLLRGC
ncbi:MAG: sugar ABC transporter substrate-binding protein, partial [Clostridiales bacterium]|nr:sugar ABC transporter substrate-binding protein [Clostridiales bacterium]